MAQPGALLFGPGETNKVFTVPILPDGLLEPNETVNLVLGNPIGGVILGINQTATLTIINNTNSLPNSPPSLPVQTNRTKLVMQPDGDLVIVDEKGGIRWRSGTAGRGSQATFQDDGNFVVVDQTGFTLWSTRTDGHNGAVLQLEVNGDVCIHYGTSI